MLCKQMQTKSVRMNMPTLTSQSRRDLLDAHGPLVSGKSLAKLLGFKTYSSFYRARAKGQLPIKIFDIAGRRGPFARTQDIASWLESLGDDSAEKSTDDSMGGAG